jgi:hypothetical protein
VAERKLESLTQVYMAMMNRGDLRQHGRINTFWGLSLPMIHNLLHVVRIEDWLGFLPNPPKHNSAY